MSAVFRAEPAENDDEEEKDEEKRGKRIFQFVFLRLAKLSLAATRIRRFIAERALSPPTSR